MAVGFLLAESFLFCCLVGEVRLADCSFPSGSSQKIPALVLRVVDAKRSYPERSVKIRSIRITLRRRCQITLRRRCQVERQFAGYLTADNCSAAERTRNSVTRDSNAALTRVVVSSTSA